MVYPWLTQVLSVFFLSHVCVPGVFGAWTAGLCYSISVAQ